MSQYNDAAMAADAEAALEALNRPRNSAATDIAATIRRPVVTTTTATTMMMMWQESVMPQHRPEQTRIIMH